MLRRFLFTLAALPLLAIPVSGQVAATVCKDGSTSVASGRGACSGHGGVDKKAIKRAAKAVKAEQKATVQEAKQSGTLVTCGDGSSSNPGRGACSHHGGVKVLSTVHPTPAYPRPASTSPATASPAPTAPVPSSSSPRAVGTTTTTPTSSAPIAPSSHRGEDKDPTGAIAQCNDGMYSHAANRRGACSRHKGVAKWL